MRGNVKTLLEAHVADAGNIKEGAERLGKDVIKTLEDPKYD
jgi:hypothetical protein